MQLVRVDHSFVFIKKYDMFFQIMITARKAKIKKKYGLITLKCIPVSMEIVFCVGVSLVRTPILG